MRQKITHLLLISLVCLGVYAQNGPVFSPIANSPIQPLLPYMQMMEDKQGELQIGQLVRANGNRAFKPSASVRNASTESVWWVRLYIQPAFSSDSFFIGLGRQELSGLSRGNDNMEVWIADNDSIISTYKTGTLVPISQRPVARPINRNLFPVPLIAGKPITVYMRISRTMSDDPLQFDFALQHGSTINSTAGPGDKLAWFYTGLTFILFMFGLVFFIITREKPFIWFTCIAAILCIHMQLLEPENSLTRWLFPEYPILQFPLFTVLIWLFGVLILQFIRSFANIKLLLPKWNRIMLWLIGYISVVLVISIFVFIISPSIQVPVYMSLLVFVANIAIGARLMLTSDLYARWSGFALLWLFIFQFMGIVWNAGLLPKDIPNPWAISQIGMMIILFFALAYRFKQSAKEKAEAAKVLEMDTIKSRFFANISHEFRTPLTLMLGPLRQMEENMVDEQQTKKYIGIMRRNGDRLLQLINQLLDLSKLESGKMELHVSKTDLTGLLKAIAHSFDSLAEQNQVNYHIHFPEENIIGFADRDKLEKIVVNLLSNAFRFTPARGTVSFYVEYDEKRLRFTVQDNGIGIPKQQLDKVFDRFQQVPGTEGGTGIGLSLTKELLDLHKGQISVKSETGKGSSFRVSIPVAAEFYQPAEISSTLAISAIHRSTDEKETTIDIQEEEVLQDPSLPLVLIVEDNTDLQLFINDILKTEFRTEISSNGKQGMQKAIEIVPDCIVSDIMMPEMDGIELVQRLKLESATSHIPFILLTARAGTGSKIEGLKTGADDYLVKPFDGQELIIRIRNLIDQRRQLRERYSRQVISIQPEALTVASTEHEFILQVRKVIEENLDNELFGVSELADAVHLSRSQLHRKLKSLTGTAPNELVRNYRLERALQLLQQHSGNISEIAFQTGFSSPAYFSKCFSDRYGYAPGEARTRQS